MNSLHHLSRREFLARTAFASAAMMGAGAALAAPETAKFSPPLALFSKVYQQLKLNFDDAAAVTAEAGLDGIDCPVRPGGEIPPERATEDMPRYDQALRKQGCRMLLLTTAITGVSSPHAEDILRTAKGLGIRYYRLGQWFHKEGEPAGKLVAEIRAQLKELAALNKELGLCAVFQNHSPGRQVQAGGDLDELSLIVGDFDPDVIGVAFDLSHAIIVHGDEWRRHFYRLRRHIRVAYVKDVERPKRFVPFGEGEFARTDYFKRLKALKLTAPISIHNEYEWAGPGNAKTRAGLVTALRRDVRVLKQWLAEA